MALRKYAEISVESIIVRREERQRRIVGPVQDLSDSIKRIGVLNPITITRDNVLIAGERRLEACKLISGEYKIPVRFLDELDPIELQLMELEENLKRSELSWPDQVRAVSAIHKILCEKDPNWTASATSKYLGYEESFVSQRLIIADRLTDSRIAKADTISAAKNIIARESQRAVDNELNDMLGMLEEPAPAGGPKVFAKIFNEDFSIWAKSPQKKFNLIHCDFPYGIDFQKSEQGNMTSGSFDNYKDSEDVYWNLIKVLCSNTEQLTYPSAHLIFWFSMKFYSQTIDYIINNSPWELVAPHPLVWMKSDNKGIVSDVTRRPRNIYETALVFTRGDRKIITPIANAYACPTSKTFHASEKPEPMLKHFFRMFVDEHTEILDPTCGSGSAIRAAFEIGAKRAIGLELNPEFAKQADGQLTRVKAMKQLEKETKDGEILL